MCTHRYSKCVQTDIYINNNVKMFNNNSKIEKELYIMILII